MFSVYLGLSNLSTSHLLKMAGCSSSFGLTQVVNLRNEVVSMRIKGQSLVLESLRFRNIVKEVSLPLLCTNEGSRRVGLKKKRTLY